MESIRAFIALNINSEIRASLRALQQKLAASRADIRWVQPENIHLTLAFLGNVAPETLHPLGTALQEHIHGLEPFRLTVQGSGVFGRRSRPSVVWAGLNESSDLTELREKVVSAVDCTAILYDRKPFRPHLTLGRFKSLNHLESLFQTLEKEQHAHVGSMEIHSIQLIQSELKPTGAAYTVLKEIVF